MPDIDEIKQLILEKPLPKVIDLVKKQSAGAYSAEIKELKTKIAAEQLPAVKAGLESTLSAYIDEEANAEEGQLELVGKALVKAAAELGIELGSKPAKRGPKPGRKRAKRTGPVHNGKTKQKVIDAIEAGSNTRSSVQEYAGWTKIDTDFRIERMIEKGQLKEKSNKLTVL